MKRSRRARQQGGSAILEFALTGVPLIFIWISTVQMGLGMWHYHTMQYAVKATGEYVSTHGSSYVSNGNTAPKVSDVATVFANNAIGIPAGNIQVTWTAINSAGTTSAISCWLDVCKTNSTQWPPTGYNDPGNGFEIRADYLWKNAIGMVAPGPGTSPESFGSFHLPAYAHQFILF